MEGVFVKVGVRVLVFVMVGVSVKVSVRVLVEVFTGLPVRVDVAVHVNVLVGEGVHVGVRVGKARVMTAPFRGAPEKFKAWKFPPVPIKGIIFGREGW